jgi:Uma2 family endonuclease
VEYDRLVGLGVFEGEPLELIGGQLVIGEPQGAYHASAISAVDYVVRAALPPGWLVRIQLPVSLDDESEPEPDLVVVRGHPRDYRGSHPDRPVLAVEVAESSLSFNREHKGSLYAPEPSALYGWRYRSVTTLTPPAFVVPLAFASTRVAVADLLP